MDMLYSRISTLVITKFMKGFLPLLKKFKNSWGRDAYHRIFPLARLVTNLPTCIENC